jgi:hypothetical protein
VTGLDWRQLNRAVLARQMLLERARLPLHRVVERMSAVQAQYIPSAYIGLWSRVAGFERIQLTSALERGSIVQGTLMRGTIHLVSRADYWPLAAAIREPMQDWWLRVTRGVRSREEMETLAAKAQAVLTDGPLKRRDLVEELGIDSQTWNGLGFWVEMVRVPPSGTWESRRADLYGLATDWVGADVADSAAGVALLIGRYLGGFGPASRDDIKAFTGLSLATIDEAMDRHRWKAYEWEGPTLFDLPGGVVPDADLPAPVRFLGTWDATLLVHCRRALILPEEFRDQIFHIKAPHSFNTFLVDGQVRGVWREAGGKVELEPFQPVPRRFQRDLEQEIERLAQFLS